MVSISFFVYARRLTLRKIHSAHRQPPICKILFLKDIHQNYYKQIKQNSSEILDNHLDVKLKIFNINTYTHVGTYVHTHITAHTYIYIYICMQIRIHTYMHTHILTIYEHMICVYFIYIMCILFAAIVNFIVFIICITRNPW